MRSFLSLCARLLFLLASANAGLAAETTAERAAAYAYDQSADLAVQEKGVETRGEATVRDISFFAVEHAKFGRVAAYLVTPKTGTPRAAVLWVHWLGEPATTNRTEFLEEAVALASRGVASLLVDAMWAKPRWYRDRVLEKDFADGVAQVGALQRALDLLQQQPGLRDAPLGIVGHDYGGMYATIAAAAKARAKTCVLIACTASLSDWAFFIQKPASPEAYARDNAPLELRTHLAAIHGASLFFQYAEQDKFIPAENAQSFFAAAKGTKQMTIYGGADHSMTRPTSIRADRTAWLVRELGLP